MDVEALADLVRRALAEDRADDDVTTLATVPSDATGVGRLAAKEPCVLAGTEPFIATFEAVGDLFVTIEPDGTAVTPGASVATVTGPLRPILTAERTALNFVQHLSGHQIGRPQETAPIIPHDVPHFASPCPIIVRDREKDNGYSGERLSVTWQRGASVRQPMGIVFQARR